MEQFDNKTILITGSCGTIGAELVKRFLTDESFNPKKIIGIDNNESAIFFQDQAYTNDIRANFFVSDIRDKETLNSIMNGVDVLFHTAALKHVVICERSPEQAVKTNIEGVQNIITAANLNNLEMVIFTSSDKAVNPTNVMGTTKLMGERLITAANSNLGNSGCIFTSTRFGNVMGSSGSVLPIFLGQIKNGGPVTLTDRDMTRFVMSVKQAIQLVLDSALQAKGGEVFVTKMPVISIEDLAKVMIEELAPVYSRDPSEISIKEIGSKPGEKLYEELMSQEETRRAFELNNFFSILPAFRNLGKDNDYAYEDLVSSKVTNPYVSKDEKQMSKDEIKLFLNENKLLIELDGSIKNMTGDR